MVLTIKCADYISQGACREVMLREDFEKCAGCAFALYCSRSCQKEDWNSHKPGCKKMDEYCCAFENLIDAAPLTKLSVDVIQDFCSRLPRRITTLQINRHWDQILSLARRKSIPLCDMAVRVTYINVPFKIEVFNYHEIFDDTKDNHHVTLVANERLRQPEEDRYNFLMVIIRMPQIEYPCIIRLDDTWTRDVSNPPKNMSDERAIFVDQDGNALARKSSDALRTGVYLARRHAAELGESVWESAVIRKATDEIITEFYEEI